MRTLSLAMKCNTVSVVVVVLVLVTLWSVPPTIS